MPEPDPPSHLAAIVARYQDAFREHGVKPESLLYRDGRQTLRYVALTRLAARGGFSVLDFGCGLGHLLPFLAEHFGPIDYTGVDMVPEFVAAARELHPGARFERASSADDVAGRYDYVVASGTFNIAYEDDPAVNHDYVWSAIGSLFQRCNVALSCDFMSDNVDFRHEGGHHQPVGPALDEVAARMSRRWAVDATYLPFEWALTVFADQARRPDDPALYAADPPGTGG